MNMTAYDIYRELNSLPEKKLAEIWQFVEFIKYQTAKKEQIPSNLGFSHHLTALRQKIEAENIDIDMDVFENDRTIDENREIIL